MQKIVTLYTWFGGPRVESVAINGIYLIRYLNFLKIPFELKLMPIASRPRFIKEVDALPIFNINGQFMSPDEALSLLEKNAEPFSPRMSVNSTDLEVLSLHQWALRELGGNYLFFMFCVKDNIAKLEDYINNNLNMKSKLDIGKYASFFEEALTINSPWKRTYTECLNHVYEILDSLEIRLCENKFLTGDDPAHCDITVFAAIHALFNPMISEFNNVDQKYPGIIKWAHEIDAMTTGPSVRRFSR
jgi:hypothetical protein